MKVFYSSSCLLLALLCVGLQASDDLDPNDDLTEEEFLRRFGKTPPSDPEEFKRREEALHLSEAEVKKVNEEYIHGNKTWYEAINEYSDLPEDEFIRDRTGAIDDDEEEDEASERYFDQFRYSRAAVPDSYNAVELGYVSPVKNQRSCGSCVAFANMGAIETCFKKLTGVFGDYSEQQMLDCGYGQFGANGCDGARTYAYLAWAAANKIEFTHESNYPYQSTDSTFQCPANLPVYNQGARVSSYYKTPNSNEDLLKKLVHENSAVVASINANTIGEYKGGIYEGCDPSVTKTNHAILVVGYGTENGVDYWLIKNSWGADWGEEGYMKLQRGVGMCGIGQKMYTVSCETTSGPTDAPLTTATPCFDKWGNCPAIAENSCYKEKYKTECNKSCGLCAGMTPAKSNYCYDKYTSCPNYASRCDESNVAAACMKTCGKCPKAVSTTTNPITTRETTRTTTKSTTLAPKTTTAQPARCYDHMASHCTTNKNYYTRCNVSSYIRRVCKKTCKVCTDNTKPAVTTTAKPCYDQMASYCTTNPNYYTRCNVSSYIRRVCKKTCKVCTDNTEPATTTTAKPKTNCYDQMASYCTTNPNYYTRCNVSSYIRRVCKKTCKVC